MIMIQIFSLQKLKVVKMNVYGNGTCVTCLGWMKLFYLSKWWTDVIIPNKVANGLMDLVDEKILRKIDKSFGRSHLREKLYK